jgi:predicted metal-dependent peptidase
MSQAGFYSHFYYNTMIDYPTFDIDTLATDGRRVFINPDYFSSLEPGETIFALVHEIVHAVDRHPSRQKFYLNQGHLRQLPFTVGYGTNLFNQCGDYVINAQLIEDKVGQINPTWLYDPRITGADLLEDVFVRKYKQGGGQGGNQGQQPQGQPGQGGTGPGNAPGPGSSTKEKLEPGPVGNPTKTAADARIRGRDDKKAQQQEGRFDQCVTPFRDPVTGAEDVLSEGDYKEAIQKAYTQAKSMGKVPGSVERKVAEIMNPQIDWREHIPQLIMSKVGRRHETWQSPNRRRLVLNPKIILPGVTRYGAKQVVVGFDCSGSISQLEYDAFFAEVGGVMTLVKPREIVVMWCDTYIRRVERVRSLSDIEHIRLQKAPGGGGSDMRPIFEQIRKDELRPEVLIVLTDLEVIEPSSAPPYPTIWCSTTTKVGSFGDTVHLKL